MTIPVKHVHFLVLGPIAGGSLEAWHRRRIFVDMRCRKAVD